MPLEKKQLIETLNSWLQELIRKKGTDLHIKSNAPIKARIGGEIQLLSKEFMGVSSSILEGLIQVLIGSKNIAKFKEDKNFDYYYTLGENYRFRFNIYIHYEGYAINFRRMPFKIQTFEQLNLPSSLHKLTKLQRGLILITGATGSGKTTTLASIIEEINKTQKKHIITIEDPIEYIYDDQQCIIEQREIRKHTNTFSQSLYAALREDPDIIVIGEIRDLTTAESILQAVSTGHLVFSSIHTIDTKETIDRLISIFPTQEHNRVRTTLAETLEAVISQRLIKGVNNTMIPAVECMYKSPLIKELIRNKRENEILDALEKEENTFDNITFNNALFNRVLEGTISEEAAYQYATSPADLKLMLSLSEEYNNIKKTR